MFRKYRYNYLTDSIERVWKKIDNCDESQNREETDETVHEISQKDGGVMKLMSSQPVTSDTIDESRSRQRQQHVEEECCDIEHGHRRLITDRYRFHRQVEKSIEHCDVWLKAGEKQGHM